MEEKTLERICELAKLEIDEQDREKMKAELHRLMEAFGQLSEVDTEGVEPMMHPLDGQNIFREDEVISRDGRADLFANAPQVKEEMLVVPRSTGN